MTSACYPSASALAIPQTPVLSAHSETKALDPRNCRRLIVINPLDDDLLSLLAALDQMGWSVYWSSRCADAAAMLCDHVVPVVLCERVLPDGGWQTVLDHVNRLSRPARLIVTARLADERLWAEVLNLGAYDLLAKPFRQAEVLSVVTSAWLSWRGECERRAKHAPPTPIR